MIIGKRSRAASGPSATGGSSNPRSRCPRDRRGRPARPGRDRRELGLVGGDGFNGGYGQEFDADLASLEKIGAGGSDPGFVEELAELEVPEETTEIPVEVPSDGKE